MYTCTVLLRSWFGLRAFGLQCVLFIKTSSTGRLLPVAPPLDRSAVASVATKGRGAEKMKRARGTVFTVPVVHGSVAHFLGEKGTEARTHKWTVYLRPYQKTLLSHFVKHIDFVLHESFTPSTRRLTEMPYEVNEFGWGEFDVIMRITFHDAAEKMVELIHPLHLFKPDGTSSTEPVVFEYYDEIVFQDPSEKLLNLLKTTPHGPQLKLKPSAQQSHYKDFANVENATLKAIDQARKRLRNETIIKQQRYEQLEQQRATLLRELNVYTP